MKHDRGRSSARAGRRWVGVLLAGVLVSGCSAAGAGSGSDDDKGGTATGSASPETPETEISVNVDDAARDVAVDTRVEVGAEHGEITEVSAFYGKRPSPKRALAGDLSADGSSWVASSLLEPGKRYKVVVTTRDDDGQVETTKQTFRTQDLSLDQQAYASVSPTEDATVGVAMPVIVRFDIPVKHKAAVEKTLEVSTSTDVKGTWSWLNDSEVHYRPKKYWPAGTKIKVHVGINGVRTAKGVWGQEDRDVTFQVTKQAVTTVVDVAKHKATVKINGKVAKVLPVTTGKPGFQTRNGTKVIMEKYLSKRMDAATTGISENSSEYYDIENVQYAMRVTNSGEFIHAAPWSVGSQGAANVSHGCVGLSTSNAQWLYSVSNVGDPVKFVNSERTVLEPQNGWTDWNVSYAEFAKGSALS